jgi:hypothetical protein
MIQTMNGREEGSPGWNVDELNIEAGVREAELIGYDDGNMKMLAAYCLGRHAKGEEDLAQRTAIGMGINLTSWYRILAAARAHAYQGAHRD